MAEASVRTTRRALLELLSGVTPPCLRRAESAGGQGVSAGEGLLGPSMPWTHVSECGPHWGLNEICVIPPGVGGSTLPFLLPCGKIPVRVTLSASLCLPLDIPWEKNGIIRLVTYE